MEKILKMLENAEDIRQKHKIKHKMKDIIAIVLLATLANANEWIEIQAFAQMHEELCANIGTGKRYSVPRYNPTNNGYR
jgi:hypothetical protein